MSTGQCSGGFTTLTGFWRCPLRGDWPSSLDLSDYMSVRASNESIGGGGSLAVQSLLYLVTCERVPASNYRLQQYSNV